MHSIHALGKQHLRETLEGNPKELKALFDAGVSGWGKATPTKKK